MQISQAYKVGHCHIFQDNEHFQVYLHMGNNIIICYSKSFTGKRKVCQCSCTAPCPRSRFVFCGTQKMVTSHQRLFVKSSQLLKLTTKMDHT